MSVTNLAAGFGLSTQAVADALAAGEFDLTRQDQDVAWESVPEGLLFYGRANASIDSRETVYRISAGEGVALASEDHAADGVDPSTLPPTVIPYACHFESNDWCSILLDSRAGAGWMTWQLLNPSRTYTYTCAVPGIDVTGRTVRLRVALRSLHPEAEPDVHRYDVAWTGSVIGTAAWTGQTAFVWEDDLPTGSVQGPEGGTVSLTERTGTTAGRGALDSITLTYGRPATGESGRLVWEAPDDGPVVATGFPGAAPAVWDVTDPDLPVRLDGVAAVARDGAYALGFRPVSGRRYAAFSPAGIRAPEWIRADQAADWTASTNAADWVAILPPAALADFTGGVKRLADFRAAQGLSTRLVTAESIADTFDGGLWTTGAIHRFVQATSNWTVRPAYVVLAGYGTVDYRLESALSTSLIPAPAVSVFFAVGDRMGEIAGADSLYGDDDGDGAPEVAIGRLPVRTPAELNTAVDKVILFETAAIGKRKALFTADNPTNGVSPGVNLHEVTDAAAADAAAGGYEPVKMYVAATQLTSRVIRPGVMAALSNGPAFLFHMGHGDSTQIGWGSAGNGILVNTLLGNVQSWEWPALALFPTCQINRFHHPSYTANFCQEAWVEADAGFAAIWAPSCKVTDYDGILLGREMVKAWALDGPLRLGDAVRLAMSRARNAVQVNAVLPCLALLGDPATVIRFDRNARDVPESWLRQKGLDAPNAGESDADLDSFPAWAEYFLETDPASGADHPLRVNRIGPVANGRLELRFASGPGSLYRILVSDRLGPDTEWTPCPIATEPGGPWIESGWLAAWGLETAVYVPLSGSARFFKVEAEP